MMAGQVLVVVRHLAKCWRAHCKVMIGFRTLLSIRMISMSSVSTQWIRNQNLLSGFSIHQSCRQYPLNGLPCRQLCQESPPSGFRYHQSCHQMSHVISMCSAVPHAVGHVISFRSADSCRQNPPSWSPCHQRTNVP